VDTEYIAIEHNYDAMRFIVIVLLLFSDKQCSVQHVGLIVHNRMSTCVCRIVRPQSGANNNTKKDKKKNNHRRVKLV